MHSFKEFHPEGAYAKGKGVEFHQWLLENHPTMYYLSFERAEGGRQDLAFDGALPIYMNRVVISEFLRMQVLMPDHSNLLESYLWHVLGCSEVVALLRIFSLYDLLLSRPLRWLAGKSSTLHEWSIYKMGWALDLAEQALVKISKDGRLLLDPTLDIFAPIAAEQPLFAAWRKSEMESTVKAPDGKTVHKKYVTALSEARAPTNQSNTDATDVAIEIAQARATAARTDGQAIATKSLGSRQPSVRLST